MAGKIKKFLKKAGKIALPVGAAFLAAKLARKKATDAPGNAFAKAKRLLTQNAPYRGRGRESEGMDLSGSKFRGGILPEGFEETETWAAKGGRIGAKHGGKVKSMGIAKRGGGVAKR
jgi:hypothetical protein